MRTRDRIILSFFAFLAIGSIALAGDDRSCTPGWSPVGTFSEGTDSGPIYAMCVFDDGSGSGRALYAGGSLTSIGGVAANRIAKWDGQQWSPLGEGIGDSTVRAMAVFDDGTGPALFVGGGFSIIDGVEYQTSGLAKWDGQRWQAFTFGGETLALHVHDDGSGEKLYMGGIFAPAWLISYDGQSFVPIPGLNNPVFALETFDDGSGRALFVGGQFWEVEGEMVSNLAKWNGTQWEPLAQEVDIILDCDKEGFCDSVSEVVALQVFDDGDGPVLYAAGDFDSAGGTTVNNIAKWNGTVWQNLGEGLHTPNVGTRGNALVVFDDGSGLDLYVGGSFQFAEDIESQGVAKWNGEEWISLSGGLATGSARAFGVSLDGLYVGGSFLGVGPFSSIPSNLPANDVARWWCIPEACMADFNGDLIVSGFDLGQLLLNWGHDESYSDLNQDLVVNGEDLGILLLNWGDCIL